MNEKWKISENEKPQRLAVLIAHIQSDLTEGRKDLQNAQEGIHHLGAVLEGVRERIAQEYRVAQQNPGNTLFMDKLSKTLEHYANLQKANENLVHAEKKFASTFEELSKVLDDVEEEYQNRLHS